MKGMAVRGALAIVALGAMVVTASAQTDLEVNAGTEFNFSSPGARSLGMGGAFIGLADDATAAYTNPAGLTQLTKPEVSVEGRYWSMKNHFTDGGSLDTPSGLGVDTVSGIVEGSTKDNTGILSFASIVYPKDKFAIAAYYATTARYKTSYTTQGAFLESPLTSNGDGTFGNRLRPAENAIDLEVKSLGLAVAYQATKELSIGVGIADYDSSLSSTTRRFGFTSNDESVGGFVGPGDYSSSNLVNIQTQNGSEKKVTFNAGVVLKASDKVRIGAAYRQGAKFNFLADNQDAFGNSFLDNGAKTATFHVPDTFGAGVVLRPTDVATLTFEYRLVKYSQLTKDFTRVFQDDATASQFKADDASELHAGFEYVFSKMKNPMAVRVGGWYDPQHRVYFTGDPSVAGGVYTALFRKDSNAFHGTAGVGMVFGSQFQLDAAIDISSRVTTGSASAVMRF